MNSQQRSLMTESLVILKEKLHLSSWAFLGVLVYGSAGYMIIDPSASLVDALYMTVITVTTVGYGEFVDLSHSAIGRLFTISLIFTGMGVILYFVSNVTAFLIDGSLKKIFSKKRMRKMISRMSGHYIVCGVGTMGEHVIEELNRTKRPAVAIDINPCIEETFRERYPGAGYIQGDASENDILMAAGVERASGIVICTDNDKDNLVITISARQINPSIRVVARCSETKHAEKLRRAGANSVVSSNFIGGMRMVSEMVRPSVVSFLDTMLREHQNNYRIEECPVPKGSPMEEKSVGELKRRILLLAVILPGGDYVMNPSDDYRLLPGSTLVFMGSPSERQSVESIVNG
ncbi:MAG: potassium transporter TrkA [Desulfuromonas sp.]|nr:MAG: potassium transporter TrkA [Desulfuromonas sp.]